MAKINTPNRFRTQLRLAHVRELLRGQGWVTATRLTAQLADKIAPETAVRFFRGMGKARNAREDVTLDEQIQRGRRCVVMQRLRAMAFECDQIQHERGNSFREPRYRLVKKKETENAIKKAPPGKD